MFAVCRKAFQIPPKAHSYLNEHTNRIFELGLLIEMEDWVQNPQSRQIIEANLDFLRKCHLQDDKGSYFTDQKQFEKADELFRRLKEMVRGRQSGISYKKTPLKCLKLNTSAKLINGLWNQSIKYESEAHWRLKMATTKVAAITNDNLQLATDCVSLWSKIGVALSFRNTSIYVVRDIEGALQGMALTEVLKMQNKQITHLHYLATRPENLPILGCEKDMVPEVGSRFIYEVVREILSNNELEKTLSLQTSASARKFYEKLGFTQKGRVEYELDEKNMIKLNDAFGKFKV